MVECCTGTGLSTGIGCTLTECRGRSGTFRSGSRAGPCTIGRGRTGLGAEWQAGHYGDYDSIGGKCRDLTIRIREPWRIFSAS